MLICLRLVKLLKYYPAVASRTKLSRCQKLYAVYRVNVVVLLPASFAAWTTPVARLGTFKSPPAKKIPPSKFPMIFQKVRCLLCQCIQFTKNVIPAIEATDWATEVARVVWVIAKNGATEVECARTAIEGSRIIVHCLVLAFQAKKIVPIMKVSGDYLVLGSSLY